MAINEIKPYEDKSFQFGYHQAIADLREWERLASDKFEPDTNVMKTIRALILHLEATNQLRNDLKIKVTLPEQNEQ